MSQPMPYEKPLYHRGRPYVPGDILDAWSITARLGATMHKTLYVSGVNPHTMRGIDDGGHLWRKEARTYTRLCCLRCGHVWIPYGQTANGIIKALPKCCPACTSAQWNKPYTYKKELIRPEKDNPKLAHIPKVRTPYHKEEKIFLVMRENANARKREKVWEVWARKNAGCPIGNVGLC